MKNELRHVRLGRTIRISFPNIALEQATPKFAKNSIPSFLDHLFWDCDPKTLHSTDPIVMERVLTKGDMASWHWLKEQVGVPAILKILNDPKSRRIDEKTRIFWLTILGEKDELQNPTQNTKESLGKTRWR
jgi:hypothetical protein